MTDDTTRLAQAPSRLEKGKAFYLVIYEKDGARWEANEHQELWCKKAEDYENRLTALAPGNGAVEADRKVDGLAKMQATEDADIDFVLGRLGLATSAGCNREIIRNFRKQIIQMAASEATHPAALDPVTVEALRPFAVLADMAHKDHRDSRPFIFAFDTAVAQRLTIGDLRRAKAALIGQPASNGEPIK